MKILTIDLEDWFHILDNESTALPETWNKFESRVEKITLELLILLDKYSVKATFFILGWVAEQFPSLVKDIKNRGHQIACHSHYHQLVYKQSKKDFEDDLLKATEAIFLATGVIPKSYRAPGFSITTDTLWAYEILMKNGYTVDCSVFPSHRSHGGMPNFPEQGPCKLVGKEGKNITCFPINVKSIAKIKFAYSGGGYFRLTPNFLLKYFFYKDKYVMTYFHPRDFDPEQPVVPGLNRLRKFKSYVGLKSSAKKLEMILSNFKFVTIDQAVCILEESSSNVPLIYLK